jgi:CheY-like chemotaxis protein
VVTLTVFDSGIGIAADALPHIFDMFWKAERQRESPGFGIGLTLVRSLVELHGGAVYAESPGLGGGTKVVVTLPLRDQLPRRQKEAAPAPPVSPPHRVLVIDDNADLLQVIAACLVEMGMECATSRDGRHVIDLMRSFKPTVVILDIGMAPVDGYHVARMIRERPEYEKVPLVALTGWGSVADVERAEAAGFNHHVLKPIAMPELQALLMALPASASAAL